MRTAFILLTLLLTLFHSDYNPKPGPVKIMMNNREVLIFSGATVADAVRAYSRRSAKLLENGKFRVFDQYGNQTEADGELTEGQKLFLKKREHEDA
jgi:hypothetical protein